MHKGIISHAKSSYDSDQRGNRAGSAGSNLSLHFSTVKWKGEILRNVYNLPVESIMFAQTGHWATKFHLPPYAAVHTYVATCKVDLTSAWNNRSLSTDSLKILTCNVWWLNMPSMFVIVPLSRTLPCSHLHKALAADHGPRISVYRLHQIVPFNKPNLTTTPSTLSWMFHFNMDQMLPDYPEVRAIYCISGCYFLLEYLWFV